MPKLQRHIISTIAEWNSSRPLSVLGPTGSGKTSTVLKFLRKEISQQPRLKDTLVVSVDSIAAYRELNVGAAKVQGADRADFNWRGLDLVSCNQKMNAALFAQSLSRDLLDAKASGRPIVFVGGTHFYERFLIEGPSPGQASDAVFIDGLQKTGAAAVLRQLGERDPRWASRLHVQDSFRIFRYGDLVLRQNLSFNDLQAGGEAPFPQVDTLVLELAREDQEAVLRARIQAMLNAGWIEEVAGLLKTFAPSDPGLQSMGYVEVVAYLQQQMSREQLSEDIFIRHRQLAKQQRTWLRQLLSKNSNPA